MDTQVSAKPVSNFAEHIARASASVPAPFPSPAPLTWFPSATGNQATQKHCTAPAAG